MEASEKNAGAEKSSTANKSLTDAGAACEFLESAYTLAKQFLSLPKESRLPFLMTVAAGVVTGSSCESEPIYQPASTDLTDLKNLNASYKEIMAAIESEKKKTISLVLPIL